MQKHTLKQSLNLKLSLKDVPQVHLISIPREVLAAPSQFELTFSKINAWPVDIYARLLPSHLGTESEAQSLVTRLLQSESYFSALSLPPPTSASSTDEELDEDFYSSGSSNPNLFNKHAHSQGLDVEKLYFNVHSRNDHYLLVGIKSAGISPTSTTVYGSFPLQIDLQPVLLGVPWPFFKLATLIVSIVIAYFVRLRRYHLRLFGIK